LLGKNLGEYEIIASLGRGGMGEVYRARDRQLGREVALKLLREDFSADTRLLNRLGQEARTLASLNHPNIATLFAFSQADGRWFLVMELVEGTDLQERLREGPLETEQAIRVATQIAEGLSVAHARGVVHRDLKPANVKITTDGRVKILDFGLAKSEALAQDGDQTLPANLTVDGAISGTPAYLAPERIRGETGDARSDIFALGILLYEMLSGTHPFLKSNLFETTSAILKDEPAPLRGQPEWLARVVTAALVKSPESRLPSAQEFLTRLQEGAISSSDLQTVELTPAIDSLAVLPFYNEAGDEEANYLIDGICDSLIDNLSQLPRLKVMAQSTVFRCRELYDRPDEVGRELKVRAVLTGRMQKRGDNLTIRSELVDARDGTRLWGGRFHRPLTDVLAIEGEICQEITDKLRFRLTHEEKNRIAKRHERDPRAHDAYMQGRFFWKRWKTADAMETAIRYFEEALAIDPHYALAHGGLADCYNILGNIKVLPPDEAYLRAKDEVYKGLAIDESLAELHASLGFILRHWDWDWEASERELLRAIEHNPGYSPAHRFYGHLLCGLGRHEEAIARVKRALELDPLSILLHTSVGDTYFYARRYEESMRWYRKAMELDEAFIPAHTDLARALELAGRFEEAEAEFLKAQALMPKGPPEPSSGLAHVYARMGRREEALAIVNQLLEKSKTSYVSPYGIASIYACMNEVDTALDWLERAHVQHDQTLVWIKVHPRLDPLRGHPRYQALLKKMSLD
jgi:serine/threonine protein kinase/tetratricopeptide (TPR) repeat protein